ncbi:hypothetical protein LCGC14_1313270 [marine sediment metagenome]|uniref:Uncharacterized protein n=1 Tax=marine sediment metagenome TaxID=412755 RepID=A0A0F9N2N7_9ZZZZ
MVMNQNPLTAPLSALKQIGEQTNVAIQSMGTGLTRATSQTLDALVGGFPPLPGMPGAQARVTTGLPGFPGPGALLPANLQQALGQVENLLIPPGLPRPSQVFTGVVPPAPVAPPTPEKPGPSAAEAGTQAARRRVAERRGM